MGYSIWHFRTVLGCSLLPMALRIADQALRGRSANMGAMPRSSALEITARHGLRILRTSRRRCSPETLSAGPPLLIRAAITPMRRTDTYTRFQRTNGIMAAHFG